MIADRYGVHHVEFQHTHFASTESSYLTEVRERIRKAKSSMNQICLEFGPLNYLNAGSGTSEWKRSTLQRSGSTMLPRLDVRASC